MIIEPVSVAEAVANELRRRLLAGEYPGGKELRDTELTEEFGAARPTIRAAVQMLVADGLLEATDDVIVLVAVWVDPNASDETAVRLANREAVRKAIGTCVEGRDPQAAARLVAERDSLRNPFYSGE